MKIVAFDTETHGLDWSSGQTAFLASWADGDGEYVADLSDSDQATEFMKALEGADALVCHNASFDVHQVRETIGFDPLSLGVPIHDTDIMSRIMYPEGQRKGERGGHGLKNLAKVWLRDDADKAEEVLEELAKSIGHRTLKKDGIYHELWRAYPNELEKYARDDARFTYDIFEKFYDRLAGRDTEVYELERKVQPILIAAEERGVALDRNAVYKLRDEYAVEAELKLNYLDEHGLGADALSGEGSQERLLEALQKLGVPLYRKTDTGRLATNQFALQEFEDDFPQLKALQEWRTATKFLSTYIEPMLDRDVVHPSFYQVGAWTSRMSCSRPNMQNIPKAAGKEVRSMFVPREGHAFVICDYEGIEIRLLAHYMADEDFTQRIKNGLDPHAWMASVIHGGSPEDYAKGSERQPLRDAAKNTLFAITYGAGGRRVTDMNNLDPGPHWDEDHPTIRAARDADRSWPKAGYQYKEGRALINTIKSALPKYKRLQGRVKKKITTQGHVNTIFGRKLPVNKNKAYVGLNSLIQGSAAEIMKQGLVNVSEAVAELNAMPLLVVHDEVLVETPIDVAEETLQRTEQAMKDAYELDPPLEVEGSIVTTNYSDA